LFLIELPYIQRYENYCALRLNFEDFTQNNEKPMKDDSGKNMIKEGMLKPGLNFLPGYAMKTGDF
jgi:hypothetical protein